MTPATFTAYRAARDAGDTKKARRLLGVLVIEGTPMVERMARRLARGDLDDLLQAGRMALAEAIDKCDPSRGLGAFRALAVKKINSAFDREVIRGRPQVLSEMSNKARTNDMPGAVKRAEQAFVARHGRAPTAEELGVDADDLVMWRASNKFDEYAETDEECGVSAGAIAAAVQDTHHALSKKIRRTIGDMTLQEQRILLARAIEGLDFAVIGQDEGLQRLTTWRIYEKAIMKLRAVLGAP